MTDPISSPPPAAAAWSKVAQNYMRYIVPGFRPAARTLCDALRVGQGDRVLDIACGPGTLAFEAARFGASEVTGVDFAADMIAIARREGVGMGRVEFLEGEATALPVLSEAFEVAASAFGIIFSPHPRAAVADMHRCVVPGGRAGILSWSRSGTIAEYYDRVYRHIPKPDAAHDPSDWGVRGQARKWFGEWFGYLDFQLIDVPYVVASPAAAWEGYKVGAGRIALSYAALDASAQQKMDAEMNEYFSSFTQPDGSVNWPREALMVTGTK